MYALYLSVLSDTKKTAAFNVTFLHETDVREKVSLFYLDNAYPPMMQVNVAAEHCYGLKVTMTQIMHSKLVIKPNDLIFFFFFCRRIPVKT